MAFMRYSPLTILRVAVSRVERERGGAAYTVSLLARDDRHAGGPRRGGHGVRAGRAEPLRLEERQRPRDPAGDDDDVRVQAVHDRPDHRAERLARLVHDGRGEGVALRRGGEDEGSRDRHWIASRRPQQDGLRLARDAGPGRIRDAPPARVEGQTTTAAAPARRAVELDGRVAELAAEAHGAPDEPTVEHEPGSEPGPGREYDERSGAPPVPAPGVGALASTTTSPSADSAPAAIVVPPTSTPTINTGRLSRDLQLAEVAEGDPETRECRTGGGCPETDHLGLALPSIAAIGQRLVEPAGMRHELGDAGRQDPQLSQGSGQRPVRPGTRLAG